ncbi:MAG: DUF4252 domain-containing protein [Saprospiraceae bacterium]|nr:DUF4252 domain-containing protein [Saprospiraceae bacterium]
MKYFLSLLFATAILMGNATAQIDAISKHFEKYMDDERFTMVYVSPKMFQMLDRLAPDDVKDPEADVVLDIAKDLRGIRILTTEESPLQHYKEFNSIIKKSQYEPLMLVRDKGQDVNFLIDEDGDVIKELLMMVGGSDEFVMLSFVGNIKLDKLARLSDQISLPGGEHLDKLEDKN